MQLPDPCICPPLPFLPTRCGRTPTPSLALCHPHPVAPTRVVLAPQAERPHRAGWMVGAGVARGASPGDRKQSSPEQAAPGRTGHTRPAVPQAWCRPHRGQGRHFPGRTAAGEALERCPSYPFTGEGLARYTVFDFVVFLWHWGSACYMFHRVSVVLVCCVWLFIWAPRGRNGTRDRRQVGRKAVAQGCMTP